MKKFIVFVMAAVAVMNFSSCNNEMDMLDPIAKNKEVGYIDLNATTEDVVVTRSAENPEGTLVNNISTWIATVTKTDGNDAGVKYNKAIGTNGTDDLAKTGFAAGNYTVAVKSHSDIDAACASDNVFGAAYYEGTTTSGEVPVVAASNTPVVIECGKPKNTEFIVDGSLFAGSALSVSVSSPCTLSFTGWTTSVKAFTNSAAYFQPSTEITYSITYSINGHNNVSITGHTLTMGAAGTSKKLAIKSNDNGTISLSIYTEGFDTPEETPITIDAATGNEVNS
jgi:hypothetical protein